MVRRSVSRKKSPSRSRSRSGSRSRSRTPPGGRRRKSSPRMTKRKSSPRMTKRVSGGRRRMTKRVSGGRKRSPNVYIKFATQYRKTHPNVRAMPVPQQGKVIGAAYRAQKGGKRKSATKRKSSPRRK